MPAIARLGSTIADPHANRFEVKLVEVIAGQSLTEALAHSVEGVGTDRSGSVDPRGLGIVAGHMIGACEQNAPASCHSGRLVHIICSDEVRGQQIIEWSFSRDCPKVDDAVASFCELSHGLAISKIAGHDFLPGSGGQHFPDVGKPQCPSIA
jgi:hypothetical protein